MHDTYHPTYYDLFHPLEAEDSDIAFYRDLAAQEGGPVLELGVGTGRTLLPIARAGTAVVGLDASTRMLKAFEARLAREDEAVRARVEIKEGDMREFELGRHFRVVQIPFRGFLHNLTAADQAASLRACLSHLEPGGVLAFTVFHPSIEFWGHNTELSGVWRLKGERETSDGGMVVLSECTAYDTDAQRVCSRLRYEKFDSAGDLQDVHLHRLELAYLYPADLKRLLGDAGFADVHIQGGFDGGPFSDESRELIVTARRPSAA